MATAAPPAKGNALTRKIGPLPTWAWVAIVAAVVLLWAWYEHSKSASAASSATTPASASDTDTATAPVQSTPPEQGTPIRASGYATDAQLEALEKQENAANEQQDDRLARQEKQIMRLAPRKHGRKRTTAPPRQPAPVRKTPVQHHTRTHREP